MSLFALPPNDLLEQITEETAAWVTQQGKYQSDGRIARLAVVEWRLQQMGYTMWPKSGLNE